jgi:ParB family chromosome partitioning protein
MTEERQERRGLGRGLSALMADINAPAQPAREPAGLNQIPVDRIEPNPNQPRRRFEPGALDELAQSIRLHGILQPIVVRAVGDHYQIVAGERRWRAAQLAQVHLMPAVVKSYSDDDVLQVGLLENIQRQDLNAIEEGQAYAQLVERFGHTQEQLAQALGKSRSHIANTLRLLSLPETLQALVRDGELTAGHARALHGAPDAQALAARIMAEGLSVRQVETLVREQSARKPRKPRTGGKDADTLALEADVTAALGLSVQISHAPDHGGGTVTIRYRSLDDLDLVCTALSHARTAELAR